MVFAPLVARTSVIAAETRIEILSGVVVLAQPDGLPKGWRGRQRGGLDRGLRAVRDPLPIPAALLSRRGPRAQGENPVGYAKDNLMIPLSLEDDPWTGPAGTSASAA